jgi:hypothetical protein
MYALRHRLVFLVVFTIGVLAFAGVAHAHGDDHRQGNSGTVKVDDDDVDDQPANHPHILCALRVVVTRSFGVPFDIDFLAQSPTNRAGDDQRLLIVHVPAGDNVTGLLDLRNFVSGIVPNPQQGFHILVTLHLPGGGEKHKVIWVLKDCPPGATTTTTPGATTTTTPGATTTTIKATTTTTTATAPTISGSATQQTTTTVPTQVLGEGFSKSPADAAAVGATSLANTGNPLSPALAVGLVFGGLGLLGAARHASGRRLEAAMRRAADRDR